MSAARVPPTKQHGPPSPRAIELASDGFLGVREAIAFSGIRRTRFYAMVRHSQIPSVLHGRTRLIPKRALIELLASAMVGVDSGTGAVEAEGDGGENTGESR